MDVHEEQIAWPVGMWPRDLRMQDCGKWMLKNLSDGARGISFKVLEASGMSPEQIDIITAQSREQMLDQSLQLFAPWLVVPAPRLWIDLLTGFVVC